MKGIVKRAVCVIVMIVIVYMVGCKKESVSNKETVPPEITQFVEQLFKAIVNEDIDYLEKVLYEGDIEYEYWGDFKFKQKDEIIKDIRHKKRIYYQLFDTNGLFEYISKYEAKDKNGNPASINDLKDIELPYLHSVKENIQNRKNLRVERVEVLDKGKNILRCHLIDDYEIEMKKKSPLSENLFLKKVDIIVKDGKIYLHKVSPEKENY